MEEAAQALEVHGVGPTLLGLEQAQRRDVVVGMDRAADELDALLEEPLLRGQFPCVEQHVDGVARAPRRPWNVAAGRGCVACRRYEHEAEDVPFAVVGVDEPLG